MSSTAKKLTASAAVLAAVGAFMSIGVFSSFSGSQTNSSSISSKSFGLGISSFTLPTSLSGLIPGSIAVRCVTIKNTGETPMTVGLFVDASSTSGLAAAATVKVEKGTGATDAACAGITGLSTLLTATTLADAETATGPAPSAPTPADATSWAYKVSLDPNDNTSGGTDEQSFQVTYQLPTTATTAAAGDSITNAIKWVGVQAANGGSI
jgi:hypothetical protein